MIYLSGTGWPKALAKDWLKAARNHLEVKLALEVNILSFLPFPSLPLVVLASDYADDASERDLVKHRLPLSGPL